MDRKKSAIWLQLKIMINRKNRDYYKQKLEMKMKNDIYLFWDNGK